MLVTFYKHLFRKSDKLLEDEFAYCVCSFTIDLFLNKKMVVFQAEFGARSGGLLKKKDTDLTKLKRPSRRHKRLKSLTISYFKNKFNM